MTQLAKLSLKTITITLFMIALIERIILALIRNGYNHPNEIYRIIDPVNKIMNGYYAEIFEWKIKILSWLPPLIHALYIQLFSGIIDDNPNSMITIFHVTYAVLSMVSVYCMWWLLQKFTDKKWALLSLLYMILWFPQIYFQFHLLESAIIANLLILSIALYYKSLDTNSFLINLCLGFLLGSIIFIRIPATFFPVFFFVYSIFNKEYNRLIPAICGFVLICLLAGATDLYFGYNFLSVPINNFNFQIIEGGAARDFGADPYYRHFFDLLKFYSPPFFLFILFYLFKTGTSSKNIRLLKYITIGYFIVLSIISHKEFRFNLMLLPLFPLIAFIGAYKHKELFLKYKKVVIPVIAITLLIGAYQGLVKYSYKPFNDSCNLIQTVGDIMRKQEVPLRSDKLVINAEHTFFCGSFPLSKIDLKTVVYDQDFIKRINENTTNKPYYLLHNGLIENNSTNNNTIQKISDDVKGWYLYLVF